MRTPPPLTRLLSYPITGGVGLLATAVTVLVSAGKWDLARFEVNPNAFTTEPWRLVTSALPHVLDIPQGDVLHLPFNLYWLWIFGTLIEDVFGHVKTLALFVLLAFGSAAAEYALFRGGIGLSGVGYGLFGMLWFLAPRDRRFADAVDARTTRLMVGWFFFCIVATALKVWAVANVAHGAGALLGLLAGAAVASRTLLRRMLSAAAIPTILALSWIGATRARPRINIAHDAHGSFQLGLDAIQAGHFDEAIHHYRVAVATDPRSAAAFYNLGIAYASAHRDDDALGAYRSAYDLDPADTRHRAVYLSECRKLGFAAAASGDHGRAVAYLAPAVEVDASDGYTWFILGQSYAALGKTKEAEDARRHAIDLAPKDPAP